MLCNFDQHGPNEHPIIDEHGHHKYIDKKSQSKINHYSKNQDTIILSSGEVLQNIDCWSLTLTFCRDFQDVPIHEEHIAEINEKKRYNPSILELKPNVNVGSSGYSHHGSHHGSQQSGHHHQPYQPLKFRPIAEIKDFKPSYQTNHDHHSDIVVGSSYKPTQPTYKPGTVLKVKPVVKKIKLVTPGLKHYATKHVARNDYQNYFRSRRQEELLSASNRMIQSMYQRNSRSLLIPQYAPGALNYEKS